jgi:hypothetical protein
MSALDTATQAVLDADAAEFADLEGTVSTDIKAAIAARLALHQTDGSPLRNDLQSAAIARDETMKSLRAWGDRRKEIGRLSAPAGAPYAVTVTIWLW